MTNNKPTRASQTKSDSTKVQSQAKTVAPKARPKVWDSTIVLRYAQRARRIQTQMGQNRSLGIRRHEKHTRTLKVRV
jgi:hypothetical protein